MTHATAQPGAAPDTAEHTLQTDLGVPSIISLPPRIGLRAFCHHQSH